MKDRGKKKAKKTSDLAAFVASASGRVPTSEVQKSRHNFSSQQPADPTG